MCTSKTHLRLCPRCTLETTVLISEQLCLAAKPSGIFGSCAEGVRCLCETTDQECWGCKD
ncbi:hypothetical protein BT67DRAFT_342790, partial [Trichocladium antarcticum]